VRDGADADAADVAALVARVAVLEAALGAQQTASASGAEPAAGAEPVAGAEPAAGALAAP